MATVSGRLMYDGNRSADTSAPLPGIANISIVLQDVNSGNMLAVLTDINGGYSFTNVPNGEYRITEAYGIPAGSTPGDFSFASVGFIPAGKVPPTTYVSSGVIPEATNLDNTVRNTRLVMVDNVDLVNQNFLNGPVKYTPLSRMLDSHAVVNNENNFKSVHEGTFGFFPPGTITNRDVGDTNIYPTMQTDYTYVGTNTLERTPADGNFTIQNILNQAAHNMTGEWWRFADHTDGNETGRMMVVNGSNPGTTIIRDNINVDPNSLYMVTAWAMNIRRMADGIIPSISIVARDTNSNPLFDQTQSLPINPNLPEWKQIGGIVNSGNNTTLNVALLNQSGAGTGNSYAIDDIAVKKVTMPTLLASKTVTPSTASVGNTVTYSITMTNTFDRTISNVRLVDSIPTGLTFIPGSVTVNGTTQPSANPAAGITIPDVAAGSTMTVTFNARVESSAQSMTLPNNATINYNYAVIDGTTPTSFTTVSDTANVTISGGGRGVQLVISESAAPNPARPGNTVTVTTTVSNVGDTAANDVVLNNNFTNGLSNIEYSLDGGATWNPWTGSVSLGTIDPGASRQVLFRGTVDADAPNQITSTATASSSNASSVTARVIIRVITGPTPPREQAVNDIIESVALQETALSHILNAEGEKMQRFLALDVTADQLITLNASVTKLVDNVMRLETVLQSKLAMFKR